MIPPECENCPLDDCHPKSKHCPLNKDKVKAVAEKIGKHRDEKSCIPENYTSHKDYVRQYNRNYYQMCHRTVLTGIRLHREEIDVIAALAAKENRTIAEYVTVLLEDIARQHKRLQ